MKTREIKELQTKTAAELRALLTEAKAALVTARLDHAQRKLDNTTSLSTLRRDIARMQTILRIKTHEYPAQSAVQAPTEGGKA
jgi:large subunit ribosomal protein L29